MAQYWWQEIVEQIELDNGMIELIMEAWNKYIVYPEELYE